MSRLAVEGAGSSAGPDSPATPVILTLVPRSYLPSLRGGLEITAQAVLETLVDLPAVQHVAARNAPFRSGLAARLLRRLRGAYCTGYSFRGYRVHTDLFHPLELETLVSRLRPDALVCHVAGPDLAKAVSVLDLPTLFYVHDRDCGKALADVGRVTVRRFAGVSRFIAELVHRATAEATAVIPPPIDPRDYRVNARGDSVLVVNPHPMKGGHRVVEIARALPWRRFIVAGGWENAGTDHAETEVERALSRLENVERIPHVSDMRTVFRRSRCLLMPSVVEEAFGRTAAEAQIAGLPVLASDRGALPETVGSGGVTLSLDAPPGAWVDVLERYFTDEPYYEGLVGAALQQAMEPVRQVSRVRDELRRIVCELIAAPERRVANTGRGRGA